MRKQVNNMRILKSLFFVCLTALLPLSAGADTCPEDHGIIRQDANLRGGPGQSFQVITPLLKGTRVAILTKQGKWLNLEVPEIDQSGWVHSDLVKKEPCTPPLQPEVIKATNSKKPKKTEQGPLKEHKNPSLQVTRDLPVPTSDKPAMLAGVIDIQRVIMESRNGIAARKKYEEIKHSSTHEDIEQFEKDIINSVIMEIQSVVESYARAHGFTHILNKNSGSIFYSDGALDITSEIIKEYDRKAASQ